MVLFLLLFTFTAYDSTADGVSPVRVQTIHLRAADSKLDMQLFLQENKTMFFHNSTEGLLPSNANIKCNQLQTACEICILLVLQKCINF